MPAAGIIGEVLVKDGDKVSPGQPLVRLNGQEDLQARIASAEYALADAQKALDILRKMRRQNLPQPRRLWLMPKRCCKDAKDDRYRKNLARVAQTTIDQKQSDLIIAMDVLKKAKEEYAKYENRSENDLQRAQSFSALAAAQQKVDQIQYDLNWLLGGPDKNESCPGRCRDRGGPTRVADAQREYDLLKDGPDPARPEGSQSADCQRRGPAFCRTEGTDDSGIKRPLQRGGQLPRVHAGEYITFGQPALQLVDPTSLRIETTDLNETDVNRIKVGDIANVTFDALPGVNAIGKVVNIGTKVSAGSGVNFTVTVELSKAPEGLRWGMTAFVVIITSE